MDSQILELSLRKLSEAFDELISACQDEDGKAKSPSQQAMMKAKGALPPHCKNALAKKEK